MIPDRIFTTPILGTLELKAYIMLCCGITDSDERAANYDLKFFIVEPDNDRIRFGIEMEKRYGK